MQIPGFLETPNPHIYLGDDWCCLDLETTNLEKGSAINQSNRLLLASWYTPKDGMRSHFGGERNQKELIDTIKRSRFIIAHHAKFELQWLERCGMDISSILVYDTMLGEWIIAGNRHIPKDLDTTATRYNVEGKESGVAFLIKKGVDPQNIPHEWLQTYCEQDVDTTVEVFLKQRDVLLERKQLHLQYSRCLLTPVLADMEMNGVSLDKDRVLAEYKKVKEEYEETERVLAGIAEQFDIGQIKWRSGKQVAELLYDKLGFSELKRHGKPDRTSTDRRKTDTATITNLVAKTKLQREFKEAFKNLSKLSARLSKTLNFFKCICEDHDGTFFGVFNQGSTGTHRLSSSGRKVVDREENEYGAQLQNLPREYKSLIKAREEGWVVVEADSSQLEFRAATDMGHDEVAYEEIINGVDIHTETAKVFLEAGTQPEFKGLNLQEARQPAKPQTFKPLYGGRGNTEAEKAYCQFFQNKYKDIYKTQTGWTETVLRDKELRTPYGMIFYWPNTTVNIYGHISNSTAIFNYPIQGFATAEIIPIVLVHAWHMLKDWNVRFILTVHDSIVLEVGPDVDLDKLKEVLAYCFTTAVYKFLKSCYGYILWVPLGVEIKVGRNWGEGKGEKYQWTPPNEMN